MNLLIEDPTPDRPDTVDCPDPDGHDRLMGQREQTWREPVRHGASGECPWCGGRLP
jgi:hypothetical protein